MFDGPPHHGEVTVPRRGPLGLSALPGPGRTLVRLRSIVLIRSQGTAGEATRAPLRTEKRGPRKGSTLHPIAGSHPSDPESKRSQRPYAALRVSY